MKKPRTLALLVVIAHWLIAIWHLFVAAEVLPGPNNHVTWLAITLISCGHLCVVIALLSRLSDKLAGLIALIFFLAALSADLYEHFLHASPNNVFMVATSAWSAWFHISVAALLTLEIAACLLGILLLSGGRTLLS